MKGNLPSYSIRIKMNNKKYSWFDANPPHYKVVLPFSTSYQAPLIGEPCTLGGECQLVEGDILLMVRTNGLGDGIFHPNDLKSFVERFVDSELAQSPSFGGCAINLKKDEIEKYLVRLE